MSYTRMPSSAPPPYAAHDIVGIDNPSFPQPAPQYDNNRPEQNTPTKDSNLSQGPQSLSRPGYPNVDLQVTRTTVIIIQGQQRTDAGSYRCQIILSIIAFKLGVLFGLIALILAVLARKADLNGQTAKAARLGRASYAMSIIGFIVAIALIVILAVYCSPSSPTFNNDHKTVEIVYSLPDRYNHNNVYYGQG